MVTMFWPISVREEIIHQDIGRPGELPDIDLMKDSMFMILDQDAYYNRQSSGGLQGDAGTDGNGTSNVPKSAKKHIVTASGVVAGGLLT